MIKKINILFAILLIALNAYGAIVISTYRKPKETTYKNKYKYKMTQRGKVLVLPDNILFEYDKAEVDIKKYFRTLMYVGDISRSTNVMNIIIEGHISSDEEKNTIDSYDKNDILFLYNRRNMRDLSYVRSYNVYLAITNGSVDKLTNYGVQDLINEYEDVKKNRRAEFILIENSNDMYVYTNYINNLIISNK